MAATTIAPLSNQDIVGLCRRYLGDDLSSTNSEPYNFEILKCQLKSTSDAPAGFLGRHQFLHVTVSINDDESDTPRVEKLRFFIKSAPIDMASRMRYLEDFGVFKKEILVYRKVLPELQKIFPDVSAKCYYADNNVLVFENLAQQGYKMAAGRDGLLNYEHLNCLLKTLAAMHAGSIVHEVRQGRKLLELYPKAVIENAYPADKTAEHMRVQNFNNAVVVFKEIIKTLPKYQHHPQLDFILREFPKQMARVFDFVKVSDKYQNVFSHGDLWANNAMFLYGKFGETPIQCRFVDFQLARYAPAMLDVITVLTIPTSRSFRERYLSELLCDYYRFMSEFLKREGLCIEDYMPKQQFDESAQEFRLHGLIESCLFSHLTILPAESTQSLTGSANGFNEFFATKRVEICMNAFRNDRVYHERLTDMTQDMVDNFVLQ